MLLPSVALAAPAPTRSTSLRVDVTGPLAELTWVRRFHHDGPEPVDTELWFAVPPAAAVDQLVVTVGDRRVESRVVARESARQQYVVAANEGRTATLLESAGGDLMVQRIANVLPGDDVEIELHLVQSVARDAGAWELVVPLTVAPRLQDPGGEGPAFRVAGPDADPRSVPVVERVDAEIAVHTPNGVQWIESPSHPYRTELEGDDPMLRIEGAPANRDLVVRWATALQDPAVTLWVAGDHALLQLEAPAPWARATPPAQDVIVVVDASDTMVGRWPRVTHAVLEVLSGLRPDDRFTVLVFADGVRGLAVRAPPDEAGRALAALDQVPLGGATNLGLALRFAGALPVPPDRPRTVVVVSDGGTDAEVHPPPGAIVHTLGVGASTHRGLLDLLAREGGGVSVTLLPGDDPQEALRPLIAALAGPVLTDVRVPLVTAPRTVPPLYADRAVTVAAEGVPCEPVVVTGRFAGAPFERRVVPRCTEADRAVEVTWARLRMEDDPAGAREVALRYHVASPWTSFVGVDDAVVNPGGWVADGALALDAPVDLYGESLGGHEELLVIAGRLEVEIDRSVAGAVPDAVATRLPDRPSVVAAAMAAPSVGPGARFTARLDGVAYTDLVAGAIGPAPLDGVGVRPGPVAPTVEGYRRWPTNRTAGGGYLWAPLAGGSVGGGAAVDAGGPLVVDHAWFAAGLDGGRTELLGVTRDRRVGHALLVAQPSAEQRWEAGAVLDVDRLRAAELPPEGAPIGGGLGWARWTWFASPDANLRLSGSWDRHRLGDARRDGGVGGATGEWYPRHHELTGAVEGGRVGWVGESLGLGSAWVEDRWRPPGLVAARFGLRVDAPGGVSPEVGLGLGRDGGWRLGARAGRTVDLARVSPSGAAPVAHELSVDAAVSPAQDVALAVLVVGAHEQLPLVPAPALLAPPALPSDVLVRDVGAVELAARKLEARRWSAAVAARRSFAPAPPAWVTRPDAAWVAGLLDPYRPWTVTATVGWAVPTDPSTLRVGGSVRWASPLPVDAAGWWLGPSTVASITLAQAIDVRWGLLELSGTGVWARNDAGGTLLPREAWALVGDRVGPGREPPLQAELRLGWQR